MSHRCTIECVRAENIIKELRKELTVLKGKLRKKNIKIGELEKTNSELRKTHRCEVCKPDCLCPEHLSREE